MSCARAPPGGHEALALNGNGFTWNERPCYNRAPCSSPGLAGATFFSLGAKAMLSGDR